MEDFVRIFLVEDEELLQDVLEMALEDGGFSVTKAFTAEQAIKILDSQGIRFRVLISDVNLGSSNMTGWDVAKHARQINDTLPVVYMPGASAHEWGSMGVPNSVLMIKPFAPAQIVTAVSQLLNMEQGS
jgi:DNA-binding NtrC family response regulator